MVLIIFCSFNLFCNIIRLSYFVIYIIRLTSNLSFVIQRIIFMTKIYIKKYRFDV